jgi:hypothetical protein
MRDKLIDFFEKYKNLFKEEMSSVDDDDILMDLLMDLIGIIGKEDVDKVIENLKNNFYC